MLFVWVLSLIHKGTLYVGYGSGFLSIIVTMFYYSRDDREIDQGIDWLRSEAGRDDIVAATDPEWVYLRTGFKSAIPPLELNSAAAERLIDTVPVHYIVVDEYWYRRYTSSLITGNPNRWKCVWRGLKTKSESMKGHIASDQDAEF